MILTNRNRRMRDSAFIRHLIQEVRLSTDDFIYPVFIKEGDSIREPIESMPGQYRYSTDKLVQALEPLISFGLKGVAIFPVVHAAKKSLDASEAFNSDGLVPMTVRSLKKKFPNLVVVTDVALDPYTTHGQDGLIDENGYVLNDQTVDVLKLQAVVHAAAGADIVAPSDMMDGRVGAIRKELEKNEFQLTKILAYSAKYASAFYGPFRDALDSKNALAGASKTTYQMNPANSLEALRECRQDLKEGADILMIKPALSYLDIIYRVKSELQVPTFAYNVSGEYAMIHAAAKNGWIDLETSVFESLLSIKRAGSDAILSYFTPYILEILTGRSI